MTVKYCDFLGASDGKKRLSFLSKINKDYRYVNFLLGFLFRMLPTNKTENNVGVMFIQILLQRCDFRNTKFAQMHGWDLPFFCIRIALGQSLLMSVKSCFYS